MSLCILSTEGSGWQGVTSLATPWHIPWSTCLQAGQAASLQDTGTACTLRAQQTMGFLLLKTSNIKKRESGKEQLQQELKAEEAKGFWGNMDILVHLRTCITAQRAKKPLS